eukprot:GDKI01008044.1.p2 GENE.GDKI01008044.1~~GDKI01008044.1.p2  ORF type:complete len:129 (-),score=47.19 GDKI01008044.1:153-539(-)
MLSEWLLLPAIWLASLVVPALLTLHALTKREAKAMRPFVLYWVLYTVVSYLLVVLEPILLTVCSYLPLNLYWEAKLALFISLHLPQLKLMDKALAVYEKNYEQYGKQAIAFAQNLVNQVKQQVATLTK